MSRSKKTLQDKYFKDAKSSGYVSRAAFKLKEIQNKHKIIPKGGRVLDLGCAPGAWLQVTNQEIGNLKKGGYILGIDIKDMSMPTKYIDERVHFLKYDVYDLSQDLLLKYSPKGFDVVLSDMLHSTSGIAEFDVGNSIDLATASLELAVGGNVNEGVIEDNGVLVTNGNLVMKIFEGSGTNEFVKIASKYFKKIVRVRPDATRKISREFYLVCLNKSKIQK